MISLIDYGAGNLTSVKNAFLHIGVEVQVVKNPSELKCSTGIVLPGVGSFAFAMKLLERDGWVPLLNESVIKQKLPFIGICLGMQLIAKQSSEGGICRGLGWVDADVEMLSINDVEERIPHIGWNSISVPEETKLLDCIKDGDDFYFVHSYGIKTIRDNCHTSKCDYGGGFLASIEKENIWGVQFHPEKSQKHGLKVINNFVKYVNTKC